MVIEVNKDIDNYQETVVMGLTAKQLMWQFRAWHRLHLVVFIHSME